MDHVVSNYYHWYLHILLLFDRFFDLLTETVNV
ncbi:hypothetical protein CY0110_17382 [Crocosphaera chwakensis CCY0110]|uniref:Uncharacterized protein n=1 Tax=Crocosphaera chwakensis CCY0110 TaxID=391612 RepID=A3IIF8_9CHRO|nr:hypothetical protein CY0110_17382 [Crocosphaera chwakensis CCY0110]